MYVYSKYMLHVRMCVHVHVRSISAYSSRLTRVTGVKCPVTTYIMILPIEVLPVKTQYDQISP